MKRLVALLAVVPLALALFSTGSRFDVRTAASPAATPAITATSAGPDGFEEPAPEPMAAAEGEEAEEGELVPALPASKDREFEMPEARAVFSTGRMKYLGRHGGRRQSFGWRTSSIRAGDEDLVESATSRRRPQRLGDEVVFDRGAVSERYRVLDGRLEQYFVLNERPPQGDLVIEGRLNTNLRPMPSGPDEVVLGRGGVAELKIDEALAVDADGRRRELALAADARGRSMTITVPADFLASARFPVVVDPLIGSAFSTDAGLSLAASNHVHSSTGGRFLTFGTGTGGAWGRFLNSSDGSAAGSAFSVPFVPESAAFHPSSGLFVGVRTGVSGADSAILVFTVNPANGSVSSASAVYTRADTSVLTYSFGQACIAATSGGFAVAFTSTEDDDSGDSTVVTCAVEALRLTTSGSLSSGGGPVEVRDLRFNWDNDDHDWDAFTLTGAALVDAATSTDRIAMSWGDNGYNGDTEIYDIYSGFVSLNTMAVIRSVNVESVSIGDDSDSWASAENPACAASDANDEFVLVWDRANFDGWYSIKMRRYNSSGAGVGSESFVRGSTNQDDTDWYNDGLVHSPFASSGSGNSFLVFFRNAGNAYAVEIAGGSSTVPATPITLASTGATESVNLAALNRADTRTLLVLNVGTSRTGWIYEVRSITAPPVITTTSLPSGTVGAAYSQTLAYTGGSGSPTWSVSSGSLPPGLVLGSSTGAISGTPTSAGTFAFTVMLSAGGTDTQDLSIAISGPVTPVITTTFLPDQQLNRAFALDLAYSGPTSGTATWTLVTGTLPAGVTMNASTGVISGTPTKTGTAKISIRVTVNGVASAPVALKLKIKKLQKLALKSAKVGVAASYAPAYLTGDGTPSFSLVSGALPPGLTLNGSTGAISGTPTANATYYFTVRVQSGGTDYQVYMKLTVRR